jgi:serine/threonine-protein kinase
MDGTPLADTATVEPPADGEARLGEVLDRRYRIDALIGEGGMAHVYRITHTMIGKSLAAKVVRHELRNDEEVIRRFLREAQIVSSIKHPNVVDISDYGETPDGGAFCVMELLRGRTLAELIDSDGACSPEQALSITLQVCQGLQHSHEAGVVHRDLKPQNIFLCEPKSSKTEPVVKLLDFGVARAGDRITVAGAVLGTPEYMSPEQVRGASVDAGADLYAVGIILFELLTAAVPFRSDDVAVTMQSQLHAPTPKMTEVDPSLASLSETQALIERLMAKDRAERPATAAEVAVLLQQAMAADLGEEAADRVVRSTLAIGSGGIVRTPAVAPTPAQPWQDGQMPWNPDVPSTGVPKEAAQVIDDTGVEPPPSKPAGSKLPWVVAATAVLASGLTIGGYAMTGGFEAEAVAPASPREVEIVSAPVPPSEEESEIAPAPGGKSQGDEQNPPPAASVPVRADATKTDVKSEPEVPAEKAAAKRPHRRRSAESSRSSKPRPSQGKRPRQDSGSASKSSAAPAATAPPKTQPTPQPKAEPKPKPESTLDGDLRNPFG